MVTGVIIKNNHLALSETFKNKLNDTSGKSEEQIRGLNQYADKVRRA